MEIRGKGVTFAQVSAIVRRVSDERYGGNLSVHQEAKPLRETSHAYREETMPWGAVINRRIPDGYGFRGRVIGNVTDGPGTRRTQNGLGNQRRSRAACWHAFRDVIGAIMREYPHATVKTSQAIYRGIDGFAETFPGTARRNIGSVFCPAHMPDLCECTAQICDAIGCGYYDGPETDKTGRCWEHIGLEDEEDEQTYLIRRFTFDRNHDDYRRVIKTGLTLDEAQEHCNDESTHGAGWFDGYESE